MKQILLTNLAFAFAIAFAQGQSGPPWRTGLITVATAPAQPSLPTVATTPQLGQARPSGGSSAGTQPPARPRQASTRTVYIRRTVVVPKKDDPAFVRVNGKQVNLKAFLKDDRVYVQLSELSALLEGFGLSSNLKWNPASNVVDWSLNESRRARPLTFGAALEALWTGKMSNAVTALQQVQGPYLDEAKQLLRSIESLTAEAGDLGVIRFSWSGESSRYRVLVEDTEVLPGTMFVLAPVGLRDLRVFDGDRLAFQHTVQVSSSRAQPVEVYSTK